MFFSLPNYTPSSRPSLLLKMKRTCALRWQTILVFSTLESAVQSLYSQKAMWRYGNLLIHSPNLHFREGDSKVTLFYSDSKHLESDTKVDFSLHCHRVSHTVTSQRESYKAQDWCGEVSEVTVLVRSERFPALWR